MGGNRRKCRKFSRLNRFLNLQESIDQYLINVYYIRYYTVLYGIYTVYYIRYYIRYIFPNFRILISFFDFLIDSQPLPFFRLVILLDIYRAYKISTISDVRHDEAYF